MFFSFCTAVCSTEAAKTAEGSEKPSGRRQRKRDSSKPSGEGEPEHGSSLPSQQGDPGRDSDVEPFDEESERVQEDIRLNEKFGDPAADEDNVDEVYAPDDEPEIVAPGSESENDADAEMEEEEDADEFEPPEGAKTLTAAQRASMIAEKEKEAEKKRVQNHFVNKELAKLVSEIRDGVKASKCLEDNVQVRSFVIFSMPNVCTSCLVVHFCLMAIENLDDLMNHGNL